jgi:hypothetical protein
MDLTVEIFNHGPFWYGSFTVSSQRPRTVLVRKVSSLPASSDLEVGVPGHWQSPPTWVSEMLESYTPTELPMDDWWKANGLAFRFMVLPPELRDNVYRHVMGPSVWPRDPLTAEDPTIRVFLPVMSMA